jgi:excinuclease ABC subunit B
MKRMMDETNRRREKQIAYNELHGIIPTQIIKKTHEILGQTAIADGATQGPIPYMEREEISVAADPVLPYLSKEKLQKLLTKSRKSMEEAVKNLDFLEAARLRDEIRILQERITAFK